MDRVAKHEHLVVSGAREHNLKDISVSLPRDALVVITGLSGSGKSSLAFDTIYAEGQRRYVESLSAYARQFLGQMDKPDVDSIEGLSPAISIDQKTTSRNPRSTVGTVTEIYDYLRLLWARVGRPHCHVCGAPIEGQSAEQIVDQVMELSEGTRFMVLAPIVRGRKGEYGKVFDELRTDGFTRAKVDGELRLLEDPIELDKKFKHDISVVVDRLVMRHDVRKRLADSVETAVALADGIIEIEIVAGRQASVLTFSERFACLKCGTSMPELEPRIFSFNSPHGACERCTGLGSMREIDPELIVPDPALSIAEGALAPWATSSSNYYEQITEAIAERYGVDLELPWRELADEHRDLFLYGTNGEPVQVTYRNRYGRRRSYATRFEGIIPNLERRYKETDSEFSREKIEEYMSVRPCPACGGARLRPESRAVLVAGMAIHEFTALSVRGALAWLDEVELTETERHIARLILREIDERLNFLENVGIGYLSMDRAAATLSGGEAQRIRLATQIGSSLVGVLYVLDEPSIGLHQRDNTKLIATLERLRDLGNTVLVVEHDEQTMRAADHVVDMGPGAGEHGGRGRRGGHRGRDRARAGVADRPVPRADARHRDPGEAAHAVGLRRDPRRGAEQPEVRRREDPARDADLRHRRVGLGQVDARQRGALQGRRQPAAPGAARGPAATRRSSGSTSSTRSSRSTSRRSGARRAPTRRPTPACSTSSATCSPRRRRRGRAATSRAASRSTSRAGAARSAAATARSRSRCTSCPDVYVPCEQCHGKRYNRETLEVRFKGKTIADVLDMPVEEAVEFFEHIPKIRRRLETLNDVGLGYIRLGQPATTLSGGEAQRVKLATRAVEGRDGAHALHPRRADDRPALRRRPAAARGPAPARRPGQQRRRHRAQPRRHQDRRPARRHGARGRGGGRPRRRRRHARGGRRARRARPRASSSPPRVSSRPRRRRGAGAARSRRRRSRPQPQARRARRGGRARPRAPCRGRAASGWRGRRRRPR